MKYLFVILLIPIHVSASAMGNFIDGLVEGTRCAFGSLLSTENCEANDTADTIRKNKAAIQFQEAKRQALLAETNKKIEDQNTLRKTFIDIQFLTREINEKQKIIRNDCNKGIMPQCYDNLISLDLYIYKKINELKKDEYKTSEVFQKLSKKFEDIRTENKKLIDLSRKKYVEFKANEINSKIDISELKKTLNCEFMTLQISQRLNGIVGNMVVADYYNDQYEINKNLLFFIALKKFYNGYYVQNCIQENKKLAFEIEDSETKISSLASSSSATERVQKVCDKVNSEQNKQATKEKSVKENQVQDIQDIIDGCKDLNTSPSFLFSLHNLVLEKK